MRGILLLLPLILVAQEQPTFRADAALVTVPVLVTDSRGTPVRDLQSSDFRLYDNDVSREISHVWLEEELPLVVGIIVDVSASQRSFLHEHRAAVDAFIARILHPGDRAFVVAVNQNVVAESEFVGRPSGVSQVLLPHGGQPLGEPCGVLRGRNLCGGTALWNAVYAAAHIKLSRYTGARALLILSDGNDTGSTHHLDQALDEVHRTGVLAYAIRYPDPLTRTSDDGLARLAAETGGAEFPAPYGDYAPIFDRIERDLRSHYVLAISPSAATDGLHRLRVEVKRPGLTVRARRQYLAPLEQ
jgi:VWFA-related protein